MKKPISRWELLLPRPLASWVPSLPWLSVKPSDAAVIRTQGGRHALSLVRLPSALTDEQLAAWIKHRPASRGLPLVVGHSLGRPLRARLERLGTGYLDARGHLHLVAPGLLIHFGEPHAAKARRVTGGPALGPRGVRAVQALLKEPGPVSLTTLARRAQLSAAQTHDVIRTLERAALVRSNGKGPSKRRTVIDRPLLLDWLARQPAAQRREASIEVALYARRPEDLWTAMTSALDRARIRHALTGVAAASLFGVGPTNVVLSQVRIDPAVSLEEAAAAIGAERTDRAPNVRLMRDTGEVGLTEAELRGGARVSPTVRIYLDCLTERRGEDIAEQFRDAVLGY